MNSTSKEKHSLTRKLVGYIGIGGNGGAKRKGTSFWERKNETTILYLALPLHLQVLKYRIFLFLKPSSLPFYTTIASNSYIPPIFLLENCFLYLFFF